MQALKIQNTSEKSCMCENWLDHWERYSDSEANKCSVIDCDYDDLVGAHVSIIDYDDDDWYIIPLCKEHNQLKGTLEIYDEVKLVPANVGDTCG